MTATSNNDDVRRMIILDRGTDSELGIVGLGYSPDNGEHFFVTNTIKGRVFRQRDVNMLWPLLVDKIKSTMSLAWDDIQGKPMLVTKEELDQRLAKLNISTTVSWNDIQNKPDVALRSDLPDMSNYVTQDQLPAPVDLSGYAKIGDIPSLNGYAKLTDIPSIAGLVKESELTNYANNSEILRLQVSEWSTVGVSLLDGTVQGSDNPVRYRVITLGNLHRVEVTGWLTTTIVGGRFNSKVRIPRMGFENAAKMSFSGGSTLSAYGDEIAFFAGLPGEINLFSGSKTLGNANFQINCHWIYEE